MKFGLSPGTIQKLQQLFSNHDSIKKVIIYGSRAKGNYREGSDIDLNVMGDNFDSSEMVNLQNEIDDLLLPYKVDLSSDANISNDDLKEHIGRVGKLFYEKSTKSKTRPLG